MKMWLLRRVHFNLFARVIVGTPMFAAIVSLEQAVIEIVVIFMNITQPSVRGTLQSSKHRFSICMCYIPPLPPRQQNPRQPLHGLQIGGMEATLDCIHHTTLQQGH